MTPFLFTVFTRYTQNTFTTHNLFVYYINLLLNYVFYIVTIVYPTIDPHPWSSMVTAGFSTTDYKRHK